MNREIEDSHYRIIIIVGFRDRRREKGREIE